MSAKWAIPLSKMPVTAFKKLVQSQQQSGTRTKQRSRAAQSRVLTSFRAELLDWDGSYWSWVVQAMSVH